MVAQGVRNTESVQRSRLRLRCSGLLVYDSGQGGRQWEWWMSDPTFEWWIRMLPHAESHGI